MPFHFLSHLIPPFSSFLLHSCSFSKSPFPTYSPPFLSCIYFAYLSLLPSYLFPYHFRFSPSSLPFLPSPTCIFSYFSPRDPSFSNLPSFPSFSFILFFLACPFPLSFPPPHTSFHVYFFHHSLSNLSFSILIYLSLFHCYFLSATNSLSLHLPSPFLFP